uniref:Uncharacterized protein n=1 Tax=Rhizophora mucronata TaxID=61149 RepID=A0A2P2P056_RHIMU
MFVVCLLICTLSLENWMLPLEFLEDSLTEMLFHGQR